MNIERAILLAMLLFTGAVVYRGVNRHEFREFDVRTTSQNVRMAADFDIGAVLDNTPFERYYQADRRNPFLPFAPAVAGTGESSPTLVEKIKQNFNFPWKDRPAEKPEPPLPPPPPPPDIAVADIPDKPRTAADTPPEQVSTATMKKDESIPVFLIGFARTESVNDPERKALLANKTTGEIYTVKPGDRLFDLTIAEITPFSIIITLKDGRTIEFLNDILKQ